MSTGKVLGAFEIVIAAALFVVAIATHDVFWLVVVLLFVQIEIMTQGGRR